MTDHTPRQLPPPPPLANGVSETCNWVHTHLGDVTPGPITASPTFRGGDSAADKALSDTNLTGYAANRNRVAPDAARGATRLSPYIRHGMLQLPTLWRYATGAHENDRDKFRDELLWQEYARHVYARLGYATKKGLRHTNPAATPAPDHAGPTGLNTAHEMTCLATAEAELSETGYLTNQQRLWLASQYTVRNAWHTKTGEHRLYAALIDGSRAANRLGWQWVSGEATGRPYAFTRRQVEQYAPGMCAGCALNHACPITERPHDPILVATEPHPKLRRDNDPESTAGPDKPVTFTHTSTPSAVWVTAESLSVHDPAVHAHPKLPVVFVFDTPLLTRLKLAPKRLVFLTETLADLATQRDVLLWRGATRDILTRLSDTSHNGGFATTFTPVPGFTARATAITTLHPWPWLRRPHAGPVTSYTAWRTYSDKHR